MIYLASPYSGDEDVRFLEVASATAMLIANGHVIYSPIVHNHMLSKEYNLPTDHKFWLEYDYNILRRCDELWVLAIQGWRESIGVTAEINFANAYFLPVKYVSKSGDGVWTVTEKPQDER